MSLRFVRRAYVATALAGSVSMFLLVPVASAAYSGTNGNIAFSSTRNSNIALYQVDPNDPVGTAPEDQAATSQLSLGGADVEPFYSPDGETAYFSSDRDNAGFWVIYSLPAGTPESASNPAEELSQVSGSESHNDYAPSVAKDDETIVFNRDNQSIDTLYASAGPSSVCPLYTPPNGLAAAGTSDGAGSRVVFNPLNPSELIYVDGLGDLHLLSGITFPAGGNPCASNQTGALTDTNLSTAAFATGSTYATGDDANPDWSPNGQEVVFNSTRGGGNTLFIINLTTDPVTGYPVWPTFAAPNQVISTEPVFSPSGTELAFVQAGKGSNVYNQMLIQEINGQWQGNGSSVNLSMETGSGVTFNSEPDWQPVPPTGGQVPESPYVPALPVIAVLVCAAVVVWRPSSARRRDPNLKG